MSVVSYLPAQNTHKARPPVLLPFIHHPQEESTDERWDRKVESWGGGQDLRHQTVSCKGVPPSPHTQHHPTCTCRQAHSSLTSTPSSPRYQDTSVTPPAKDEWGHTLPSAADTRATEPHKQQHGEAQTPSEKKEFRKRHRHQSSQPGLTNQVPASWRPRGPQLKQVIYDLREGFT